MKRSWRTIGFAAAGMLVGAALVGVQLLAQAPGAPPGGGGPGGNRQQRQGGGGFGGFNPTRLALTTVQGSWTLVSFGMDVSNEKLVELRPIYKKAYDDAQALAKQMEGVQPDQMQAKMQEIGPKMAESQKALLEGVKAKLTPDQSAKLTAWYEEQAQQAMRFQGGGGNRPGGGGAGGGRPNN